MFILNLVDLTLNDFAETTASDSPAPGGGSVSALAGALGAALTSMVCALTVGKKKYADVWDLATDTRSKALAIEKRCLEIIDLDTQAFNGVSAVFAMPKDTEEQKCARKAAMQKALKGCTETPIEMMRLSGEALELVESVQGKLNSGAASDLGCAVLALKASMQGAWLNVLINIGGIEDGEFAGKYRAEGEKILEKALPLADRLYSEILESLK